MVTIILPISRKEYLKPVFASLEELERPSDTELLIVRDGDEGLAMAIDKAVEGLAFSRIRIITFGIAAADELDTRRYRIAAIHNFAKHYVPETCEFVLSLEDDTTYPPDALTRMLKVMANDPNCAFVEGVELGRRNTPYIGGWKANDIHEPYEIVSVMPSHGLQSIDAGGLYCSLVDADLYKMHHFEPYDSQGTVGLGCDINLGLYLRQQGYTCLIDHSIQCEHLCDKGAISLASTKPSQVIFELVGNTWSPRVKV